MKQLVNCVWIQFLFKVDFGAHVHFQPTIHRRQNFVDFLPSSMDFVSSAQKDMGREIIWVHGDSVVTRKCSHQRKLLVSITLQEHFVRLLKSQEMTNVSWHIQGSNLIFCMKLEIELTAAQTWGAHDQSTFREYLNTWPAEFLRNTCEKLFVTNFR